MVAAGLLLSLLGVSVIMLAMIVIVISVIPLIRLRVIAFSAREERRCKDSTPARPWICWSATTAGIRQAVPIQVQGTGSKPWWHQLAFQQRDLAWFGEARRTVRGVRQVHGAGFGTHALSSPCLSHRSGPWKPSETWQLCPGLSTRLQA